MSVSKPVVWNFDRHLRYDELVAWLRQVEAAHPSLVSLEEYGTSHEGRPLLLANITDQGAGPHHDKPAHWVDAAIHATELTATVAACVLIDRLVTGHAAGEPTIINALTSRAFYVVPRVNPDGAEAALGDTPRFLRSSTRQWPWATSQRWPGLQQCDVDGDGRILDMRILDPNGAWMPHPDDTRLMIAVPASGAPEGTPRYRLLTEGDIADYDGWTIPTPRDSAGLDLNRNFPSDWSPTVTGSGDHPLSEPEVDALVRAMAARPNICGTNAFHTSGGVLLRPSSTKADSALSAFDRWVFDELGACVTDRSGYRVHSTYEDFTLDQTNPLSGAADDWAYEHLGVFSWTTEFWDIVKMATGDRQSTLFWYHGPTNEQALAVLAWVSEHHPEGFVDWYEFDHPQLGPVELGGWDDLRVWTNPPDHLLHDEVRPHADAAVAQAMASPKLEILHEHVERLDGDHWLVQIGIANTGWLPTDVSAHARKLNLVRPVVAALEGDCEAIGGPLRQQLGQLAGRSAARFAGRNDGTPERMLVTWTVRAQPGTDLSVTVSHQRAGTTVAHLTLEV